MNLSRFALSVTPVGLGQSALLVYLPLLVEYSPFGYGQWAQLFALGMLFYFAGSIAWPLLLPKLGYGTVIRGGLTGFATSMGLLGACLASWQQEWISDSQCWVGLAFSRMVYGLFASALVPASQSGCAQIASADQRLQGFSSISLYLAIGRTTGPVFTLLAAFLHWLGPVIVLLIWPLLVLGKLHRCDFPCAPSATKESDKPTWLTQFRAPYGLAFLAMACTAFASSLQFLAAPVLEQLQNSEAQQTTILLAALMVGAAIISVIAHTLQSKLPPPSTQLRMLLLAILLFVCGMGLLLLLNLGFFLVLVLLASAALALLTPLYSTQLSLRNSNPHQVAAQLSLTHLSGHFIGLSISAWLLETELNNVFLWLITLSGVMMVSIVSSHIPTERR